MTLLHGASFASSVDRSIIIVIGMLLIHDVNSLITLIFVSDHRCLPFPPLPLFHIEILNYKKAMHDVIGVPSSL